MGAPTSRRALLGAIAASPLVALPAAATPPDEARMQAHGDRRYDLGYEEGWGAAMYVFAFAWLSRWTDHGGGATIEEGGGLSISWPMYRFSPVYKDEQAISAEAERLHGPWPEAVRSDRHSFMSAFHDGKMRELQDLLNAVPGGLDAVKLLVSAVPGLGQPRREAKPVQTDELGAA